jgi:predicted membrane protein
LFGKVTVLNQKRGGIGTEIFHKSDNYDAAEKKLNITASQVFGDLRIW